MSLNKRYLKSRPICKVTFRLKGQESEGAQTVHLVGEFNNWDKRETPMQRLKNGDFKTILDLPPGRSYQFRYLINGERWINDPQADGYAYCAFGNCENSVLTI